MTGTEFNTNDHVWVRLTDHGKNILRLQAERLQKRFPHVEILKTFKLPEENDDGWSRWQLWGLMNAFGPHCYNGCVLPFETTIVFEK